MGFRARTATLLAIIVGLLSGFAEGAALQYRFKPGGEEVYQITVRTEYPAEVRSTTGYLVVRTKAVDAASGEMQLLYAWAVSRTEKNNSVFNASVESLAPIFTDPPMVASPQSVVIDPLGGLRAAGNAAGDAQLESGIGPAWQLVLPPLPSGGQTDWQTHQQLHFVREADAPDPNRGGQHVRMRIESPADERVSYALVGSRDDSLTVSRKYDMSSLEKIGDTPEFALRGDGTFDFDANSGMLTALKWNMVRYANSENVSLKVPVTVTATLLSPTELTDFKKDMDAAIARRKEQRKEQETVARREAHTAHELLPGTTSTEICGHHTGGGPFTTASNTLQPVLGFRFEVSTFGSRPCFRSFEPLFEPPAAKEQSIVMAKEGYAVGGITVVANEFFNAVRVTFMKKTATGLDVHDKYQSDWYGTKLGDEKELGDTGEFVVGITGRRGLNVDDIGLVMKSPSAPAGN